ncbi:hypothetical protein CF65_01532 [Aggregatibacter actinomycetemcomitans HK1651]|nr:hypothetical protein CF65_01532 [Aggregatibacter actinomycetemcomitans HK1651]
MIGVAIKEQNVKIRMVYLLKFTKKMVVYSIGL